MSEMESAFFNQVRVFGNVSIFIQRSVFLSNGLNLMYIGPCIIVMVEE